MKGHPKSKRKTPATSGTTRRSTKLQPITQRKEKTDSGKKGNRLIEKLPYVRALVEILIIIHTIITGGSGGDGSSN
jgi:hypothetical protein